MGLFSRKPKKVADKAETAAANEDKVVELKAPEAKEDSGIEISKCIDLVKSFPLGPVALSPNFEAGKVQESVLLGYQFDKKRVYVGKKLEFDADEPTKLEIECDDETHSLERVEEFYFMVAIVVTPEPDEKPKGEAGEDGEGGESESAVVRPLSFPKGRELEIRGFPKDSQITQCRALVKKRVALRRGVYEGHQVMLLEPRFDSVVHPNQRSSPRIEVKLTASIDTGEGKDTLDATLVDFSETMHRLEFAEPEGGSEPLELGKDIRFSIEPEGSHPEKLVGTVVKRRDGVIVAEIKTLTLDGIDVAMSPLHALSLKTRLMQY